MQNIRKIIGKTIVIRKAEPNDLESVFYNVWSDSEVLSTTLMKTSANLEEAKGRLERTMNFQSDKDAFFLALKDTNEVIGLCGIIPMGNDVFEEGGFIIGKRYQHKGYGTEMLNILLDVAFNYYGCKEFVYSYCVGNDKSQGLCRKFGFHYVETKAETREWDQQTFQVNREILKKEEYKGINFKYEIL